MKLNDVSTAAQRPGASAQLLQNFNTFYQHYKTIADMIRWRFRNVIYHLQENDATSVSVKRTPNFAPF